MTGWPWLRTEDATKTLTRLVAECEQLDRDLAEAERRRTETAEERDRREWMDRR